MTGAPEELLRAEIPAEIRERLVAWWRREGTVVHMVAPREGAWPGGFPRDMHFHMMAGLDPAAMIAPLAPLEAVWCDAARRVEIFETYAERTHFGGVAYPYFDAHLGPGSLALYLGARPELAPETIWFRPAADALDGLDRSITFDPEHPWFRRQCDLLESAVRLARGRYPVGMPDLVQNLDVLASLRGAEALLLDLLERPALVKARLAELDRVYFEVFDRLHARVADAQGGNTCSAFRIRGPGRTAVVQCDAAAMISPAMFEAFVVPGLAAQCAWLDHSLYHLDGTQALPHLDAVLAIDDLDAVEWTPQAGRPRGGDPTWYPLYRRILEAGKSVQVIDVDPHEIRPLLNAIGTQGVFVLSVSCAAAATRPCAGWYAFS